LADSQLSACILSWQNCVQTHTVDLDLQTQRSQRRAKTLRAKTLRAEPPRRDAQSRVHGDAASMRGPLQSA
jgi:hypothetical protein